VQERLGRATASASGDVLKRCVPRNRPADFVDVSTSPNDRNGRHAESSVHYSHRLRESPWAPISALGGPKRPRNQMWRLSALRAGARKRLGKPSSRRLHHRQDRDPETHVGSGAAIPPRRVTPKSSSAHDGQRAGSHPSSEPIRPADELTTTGKRTFSLLRSIHMMAS